MMDQNNSKQQPSDELAELRHRVATLEAVEEELRKSRALLQATIDNLPFDFFAIGMDGRYMLQNATSKAHWGDAVGKRPEDAAENEETLVLWKENIRRAFAGEKVEEDVTVPIKGERRYYHNVIAPIIDAGQTQGILGINVDITERKRAEAGLRESESRLRSLFQKSSVGAAVVTPNGQFLQVNRAFCDFLGYSESELIGQTVLSVTHPDDREASSTAIRQAAESVARIQRLEKRYLHEDGQVVWGEVSSTLMHDAEGKPDYFITQILDITERKRADEALKKAHDELERRVEERTAKLAEASQQLRREIEERKAAEGTLRESEERYKTLVDTSPDVVIMADLTGHVSFVSRRLVELHGAESADEFLGKTAWDFLVPEDHEKYHQYLQKTLEDGITSDVEYTFIKKDGTRFPAELSSALVKDAAGKPVAIINVLRDITERKQAEKALRQSHDELRGIYDGLVEGLLVTDSETKRFMRANASVCRMLGYSEAELLSMSVKDIHPVEALPYILERIGSIKETNQPPPRDIPFLRKDGSVFYVEVVSKFLVYNGRPCSMGIFRDITERKQMEEALAESEAKYRQLVETTDTGYLILDAEGLVVDANKEYVRISGHHDLAEIVGHSVVEWTAPYDRPRNAQEVRRCVQAGRIRQLEVDYIGPDGGITPVEINASVVTTKEGKRIVSLCRDITERRQAQDALERERQSLWRMFQASDHERQIISYEIHDGLAQYLAAAGMQLQVFDGLRESKPDEARKAYDAATQLVSQAHSESRRLISEVRHPVIDESGLETAISHLVHEQRRHGGPKIECRSSVRFGRLPVIMENALYRIVQEALTNACKHSKSEKVTVSMTQEGQDVRLEVRDWGIGFDQEAIGKGHFGVEGIRQRVRLLDGRLTIESSPGSGTRVQVVVPILEKQIEG